MMHWSVVRGDDDVEAGDVMSHDQPLLTAVRIMDGELAASMLTYRVPQGTNM